MSESFAFRLTEAAGGCRGAERGTARPEVLQELLKTTERVVQEIDSVEYGLTDIQEYYGALPACSRLLVCTGTPVT